MHFCAVQALLRCAEHFKDLSDVDMEMKMTRLAEGRFEVWQESCQSKVEACFKRNVIMNEGRAGKDAGQHCLVAR